LHGRKRCTPAVAWVVLAPLARFTVHKAADMNPGRPWLAIGALGLVAACSIADPHRPQWLEAHGHNSVHWIAAVPFGVLGIIGGGKIQRYPGGWNTPWEEHTAAEATQIAGDEKAIFLLTADGAVVRKADAHASPESLTNGGGIARFAVSSSGDVHVLAQGHAQRLVEGRLVDTPCTSREAKALAVGGEGTYLLTAAGTLAVETAAGACQDVPTPFVASDIAASDMAGGNYSLAAVDNRQKAWLLRAGSWDELPPPIAYRAGYFPRVTGVVQVAMSALTLWARTNEGWVFAFSDPR
jgi:hypothetical protein